MSTQPEQPIAVWMLFQEDLVLKPLWWAKIKKEENSEDQNKEEELKMHKDWKIVNIRPTWQDTAALLQLLMT